MAWSTQILYLTLKMLPMLAVASSKTTYGRELCNDIGDTADMMVDISWTIALPTSYQSLYIAVDSLEDAPICSLDVCSPELSVVPFLLATYQLVGQRVQALPGQVTDTRILDYPRMIT